MRQRACWLADPTSRPFSRIVPEVGRCTPSKVLNRVDLPAPFGPISPWIVPVIVVGFLTWGVAKGVPVYETFVEGAKDGFETGVRIIPYLVAILGVIGMMRGSGATEMAQSMPLSATNMP